MNKIIKIEESNIKIGTTQGEIIEVNIEELDFVPQINDCVEIYSSGSERIIQKKHNTFEKDNGINININNNNQQDQSSVNQNTNNNYSPVMIGKKAVNKNLYIVLCIFLGFLGGHKFYEGKIVMGILYIFTAGLFGIGIILGLIKAISQKADIYGNIYV